MPKDSQPSLDLASATSGDKIVTAQVLGNGYKFNNCNIFYYFSVTVDIMYSMSAKFQENGKAADGQTTNEVLGPQRPRSNSGRELTDEVLMNVVCTQYVLVLVFPVCGMNWSSRTSLCALNHYIL